MIIQSQALKIIIMIAIIIITIKRKCQVGIQIFHRNYKTPSKIIIKFFFSPSNQHSILTGGLKGTGFLFRHFPQGWVLVQAGHLIEVWVLIRSFMVFPEKYWFEPGTCFILKLEEYGNDHRRHAPITLPFQYKFSQQKLQQIFTTT